MENLLLATLLVLWILLISTSDAMFICDKAHDRFRCINGECVTLQQRCDFREDCTDKSDELDCEYPSCDNSTHFTCKNKKCIYKTWICDGNDDCFDGSDEESSLCSGHECSENEFTCRGSQQCFPDSYKCDGEFDCDQGDDEEGCNLECGENEFKCADGRKCVNDEYRCDGDPDCKDGSDEENCENQVCADDQFSCASGDQCIPESSQCDGMSDCHDESDEQDCEDEESEKCPPNYFACKVGGGCIPLSWKCDGNAECSDGSDELHCDNIKDHCEAGERLCANQRQCVSKTKFCDGKRDCIDKSDEKECPEKPPTTDCPHDTHFKCPGENGKCIPEAQLCDLHQDCEGGEDEQTGPHLCGYNECSNFNGNCSHLCHDRGLGYDCSCPVGLELEEDGLTCRDINECNATSINPCDHFCFNTEGSYKCTCWAGYTLVRGRRCKPTTADNDVTLIVADRIKIENVTLDNGPQIHVLLRDVHVKSVAVDIKDGYFYWSDTKNEKISRAKLSDPKSSEVILDKKVVRTPHRIAVDWVHRLLFWVDVAHETVSVSHLDGTKPKTLYRTNTPAISVAVYPKYGYLYLGYLSAGHGAGKIERCGMDGDKSSCKEIVTQEIMYPNDIAIDYDQDLLYWVDGILNVLVVSDLDGNDRRSTIVGTHIPVSIAVFSGRVYFTDAKYRQLVSTNRTGGDMKIIKEKLSSDTDIAILNKQEQPSGNDHCDAITCDWLCLPKSGASEDVCACPDHYAAQNGTSSSTVCIPTSTTTSPSPTTASITTTVKAATSTTTMAKSQTTTSGSETTQTAGSSGMSTGTRVMIIIGILALIVLVVVITLYFVVRWRRQRSARMSMNFNNPIYRKVNESIASSSSFQDKSKSSGTPSEKSLTDPSPSTSAGDVSTGGTRDPTAALILNEEVPDGSDPDLRNGSGIRFTSKGIYDKVPNGDMEIEYHPNNSDRR